MNGTVASTRLILGALVVGGLVLVACDDEDTSEPTPTGAGTTSGTSSGTSSGTGAGTGAGTAAGTSTGTGSLPTCQESCVDVMAAGCANGPGTTAECEAGCEAARVYCMTEVLVYAGCVGPDGTLTCDAEGEPVVAGCETQFDAVQSCLAAVAEGCEADCPDVVAAGCADGPPDVASCEQGCSAVTMFCPDEYLALDTCAGATPTYVCNTDDQPMPQGCDTEHTALMACLESR